MLYLWLFFGKSLKVLSKISALTIVLRSAVKMGTEKEPHNDDEKAVYATQETEQDLSTGECTDFQVSPEAERRLLWKLDLL